MDQSQAPVVREPAGEPDPQTIAAERMTFFADAVIAIAITLLALELPVPEGGTNHDMWTFAVEHRDRYLAFLISFYVIGVRWSAHHRVFRYVNRLGAGLPSVSLAWLLMVVVTPFATELISSDGGFQVRFGVYAAVQGLAGVLFLVMVRMVQVQRLYRPDTPPELFPNAYFGTGAITFAFLVSIPVSFFTTAAFACWIFLPPLISLARKWRRVTPA